MKMKTRKKKMMLMLKKKKKRKKKRHWSERDVCYLHAHVRNVHGVASKSSNSSSKHGRAVFLMNFQRSFPALVQVILQSIINSKAGGAVRRLSHERCRQSFVQSTRALCSNNRECSLNHPRWPLSMFEGFFIGLHVHLECIERMRDTARHHGCGTPEKKFGSFSFCGCLRGAGRAHVAAVRE